MIQPEVGMLRTAKKLSVSLRNRFREALRGYEMLAPAGPSEVEGGPDDAAQLMANIRQTYRQFDAMFANRVRQVEADGGALACKGRGCSFCCYDYAMVTPPEMLLVIDAFERLDPVDKAHVAHKNSQWLAAHADDLEVFPLVADSPQQGSAWFQAAEAAGIDPSPTMIGMTTERNFRSRTPCSFLKDGGCLIYADRPLACRGHNSIDPREPKDSCERKLWDTEPVMLKMFDMSDAAMHFLKVYRDAGLPIFPNGDLNAMMGRWLQAQSEKTPALDTPVVP